MGRKVDAVLILYERGNNSGVEEFLLTTVAPYSAILQFF